MRLLAMALVLTLACGVKGPPLPPLREGADGGVPPAAPAPSAQGVPIPSPASPSIPTPATQAPDAGTP